MLRSSVTTRALAAAVARRRNGTATQPTRVRAGTSGATKVGTSTPSRLLRGGPVLRREASSRTRTGTLVGARAASVAFTGSSLPTAARAPGGRSAGLGTPLATLATTAARLASADGRFATRATTVVAAPATARPTGAAAGAMPSRLGGPGAASAEVAGSPSRS